MKSPVIGHQSLCGYTWDADGFEGSFSFMPRVVNAHMFLVIPENSTLHVSSGKPNPIQRPRTACNVPFQPSLSVIFINIINSKVSSPFRRRSP